MLSKEHPGEQGKGVAEKGRQEGQQDQHLPVLHPTDAHKGGEKKGNKDRKEEGPSHFLRGDRLVAADGPQEQEEHIHKEARHGPGLIASQVDPERDETRQHDGAPGKGGILQKARGPEHLMDGDHGQNGHRRRQYHGKLRCQAEEYQKNDRDKDHGHQNTLPHQTPPNRRERV